MHGHYLMNVPKNEIEIILTSGKTCQSTKTYPATHQDILAKIRTREYIIETIWRVGCRSIKQSTTITFIFALCMPGYKNFLHIGRRKKWKDL